MLSKLYLVDLNEWDFFHHLETLPASFTLCYVIPTTSYDPRQCELEFSLWDCLVRLWELEMGRVTLSLPIYQAGTHSPNLASVHKYTVWMWHRPPPPPASDIFPRPYSPARTCIYWKYERIAYSFFSTLQLHLWGWNCWAFQAEIRQATVWVVIGTAKVDCLAQTVVISMCGQQKKNVWLRLLWNEGSGQIEGNNLTGSKLSLKRLKNSMSVL